ncbi:hypothetical protein [Chromobacterium phragmitis]|uniref:Uncharacterized protein n=1 Tax=Chromobacterium phragmitis TaxID=2202141 RepID=A0ABV0IV61_9NEIS|nr:hypothetical protein [Chromobacterium phragmitis]
MKNPTLQAMLDELEGDSDAAIQEISGQDLEFVSGGEMEEDPTQCDSGYVRCDKGFSG